MSIYEKIIRADSSIKYQYLKDVMGIEDLTIKEEIAKSGYGKEFLGAQNSDYTWGEKYYFPKWRSSHYTLLDLRNLRINPVNAISKSLTLLESMPFCETGGVRFTESVKESDVCVNGMMLNFMSYFGASPSYLHKIIDYIIEEQMPDGGYNCQSARSGAYHSSLHSTISVLEGIETYKQQGNTYKIDKLDEIQRAGDEFILQHKFYKSDKTGEIIKKQMTMLSFPSRWYYDVLRGLDYFAYAGVAYDERMDDAIELLIGKRRKDGFWPVQKRHQGETHFQMEKTGGPSNWNTLRAQRVLLRYNKDWMLNDVLLQITDIFNKEGIRYGIGASLLLKKFEILDKASDIDIIVYPDDAEKVYNIMSRIGMETPSENLVQYYSERFMEFIVDGIEVDLMCRFTIKKEDGFYVYPFTGSELECVDQGIPYLSLKEWEIAYRLMGRKKKADLILDYLSKEK